MGKMGNTNYTVYVKHRPLRILYIVNKDITSSHFDSLLKFNYDKWGGRYNPILINDRNGIDQSSLKFIKEYDPDIIKSLTPINFETINVLNSISSPFLVEVPSKRELEDEDPRIHLSEQIQSIHPTPEVLRELTNRYHDEITFITFDTAPCKDETIKLFVNRNFGDYPFSYWSSELFDNIDVKTYNISDKESLLEAIAELSDYSTVVFPSQLCSLSYNLHNIEYHRMADVFSVTIGNEIEDLCLFWNNILNTRQYSWPRFNQLWIPIELASDESFQNSLKSFLNVKVTGDRKEIQFISRSIQPDELNEIATNFTKDVWLRKFVNYYENSSYPTFSESYVH